MGLDEVEEAGIAVVVCVCDSDEELKDELAANEEAWMVGDVVPWSDVDGVERVCVSVNVADWVSVTVVRRVSVPAEFAELRTVTVDVGEVVGDGVVGVEEGGGCAGRESGTVYWM